MLKSLGKNASTPRASVYSPCCAPEHAQMTLLPAPRAGEIEFHHWHKDIDARIAATNSESLSTTQIARLGNTPDALMGCAVSAIRYSQIGEFIRQEARWAIQNPMIMQALGIRLDNPACTCKTRHLDADKMYVRIPFEFMDGSRDFPVCSGWWCIPADSPRVAYAVGRMAEKHIHRATMNMKARCESSDTDVYTTDPECMELTWMPARSEDAAQGRRKRRKTGTFADAGVIFDQDSLVTPPCIKRLASPIMSPQTGYMKHEARWAVAEYAALIGIPWAQLKHRISAFYRHRPDREVQSDLREMQSNYNRAASGSGNKAHTCHGMFKKHVCPYPTPTRHLCYGCAPGAVDIEDLAPHKVTLHKCGQ